jgi:glycosyltransferase involved in cell wall biosynthesis
MGRPVIATRVGGLPEIVVHRQNGLLVDKEDIQGLAGAVSFLLDNPELAAQMGQAGRARVKTNFNWEVHVDSYDRVYRELVAKRPAASLVEQA